MTSENQAMRYRRLAFYSDDIERLNEQLNGFVKKAGAVCALLIDKEGHMVAKQGFIDRIDTQALAALVAGSYASTREVAKLLGEREFSVLFHQGQDHSILLLLIGDRTLQVTVFNSTTKQGLIQVMSSELGQKVGSILEDIASRPETAEKQETLKTGYSDEMSQKLDDLFGDL
jgi:predicted regulator of Ras-like GTPase activity (Roadblock/LC7/MglB family)